MCSIDLQVAQITSGARAFKSRTFMQIMLITITLPPSPPPPPPPPPRSSVNANEFFNVNPVLHWYRFSLWDEFMQMRWSRLPYANSPACGNAVRGFGDRLEPL